MARTLKAPGFTASTGPLLGWACIAQACSPHCGGRWHSEMIQVTCLQKISRWQKKVDVSDAPAAPPSEEDAVPGGSEAGD